MFYSPDNSPDEASPVRLAQPLESARQVLSKKDSSLSCSDCSLDLKIFSESDSTIDDSSRFQVLIILSLKKCRKQ